MQRSRYVKAWGTLSGNKNIARVCVCPCMRMCKYICAYLASTCMYLCMYMSVHRMAHAYIHTYINDNVLQDVTLVEFLACYHNSSLPFTTSKIGAYLYVTYVCMYLKKAYYV